MVFGAGKTPDQVVAIAKALYEQNDAVLATRTAEEARVTAEFFGSRVVNIDNGFGAGYLADMLNKL